MREGEEAARFLSHVLEIGEAERLADDVEEVAVLSRRAIGPLSCRAFGGVLETDIQRASGGVLDIPDQPVVAGATAGRQLFAADRLGLSAETVCQFRSVLPSHHAASRSLIRSTG